MIRFLIDANLPPAFAVRLTELGHGAEHLADRGLLAASDREIWRIAMAGAQAIITKDEDFARRRAASAGGPPIVWIRLNNTRRAALLAWFDRSAPGIVSALERGETIVEVF